MLYNKYIIGDKKAIELSKYLLRNANEYDAIEFFPSFESFANGDALTIDKIKAIHGEFGHINRSESVPFPLEDVLKLRAYFAKKYSELVNVSNPFL